MDRRHLHEPTTIKLWGVYPTTLANYLTWNACGLVGAMALLVAQRFVVYAPSPFWERIQHLLDEGWCHVVLSQWFAAAVFALAGLTLLETVGVVCYVRWRDRRASRGVSAFDPTGEMVGSLNPPEVPEHRRSPMSRG